jgi:hypothetical protein
MQFQKIVLIVATIILIFVLTVMGVLLSSASKNLIYAPEIGTCPDYFEIKKINNEDTCFNVKNLGKCASENGYSSKDFGTTIKSKNEWATKCDLTWDGITNV